MKHALTFIGAILTMLILSATGGYVLWQFHSTAGLIGGVALILFGLAIAAPMQFGAGASVLRKNVVLVVPVIVDSLKGGKRKSDPPHDPPAPPDTKDGMS